MDIVDACDEVDADAAVDGAARPTDRTRGTSVRLADFEIADGAGRPLLWGEELSAAPGESVHVSGDSSTGKSTLVRVLAGLWPSERGKLAMPDSAQVMVTPQKSYLPLGSLKGALFYPDPDPALGISDARLQAALERVGLGALTSRLEEVARWDQVLSNGERQRLAIARVLIHRPQVVILDDALSALDEASQQAAAVAPQERPARGHHHQPRPASGAGRPARPSARAAAPCRRRRAHAAGRSRRLATAT